MAAHAYGDDTPITAFATAPGGSALTLIRCSGKDALNFAARIFSSPKKILEAAGNTVIHGWITETREKERIDEVLVSVFRAPKSYTGEDSLDISCHGGAAAGKAVMSALLAAGFREALPGEFTFRAFINGKIDLTRSESVMELVSAKTECARRNAVSRLSGALEHEINDIKKILVELLGASEILLDYSEDEISAGADEISGRLPGKELALKALARLTRLAESWQREKIYQEGALAVIAGRPNAGKSSLFNLLVMEERSIVTPAPGTTRDWIEAWVSIAGIPVRLADTAGLRNTSDPVEKIGVERSRDLLEAADLVLYLIDGTEGLTNEDTAFIAEIQENAPPKPLLLLWNKADISPSNTKEAFLDISAKTGLGMAELTAAIRNAIIGKTEDSEPIASVGTERQKTHVDTAVAALEEALRLADGDEPLDIIAPLLREAVNALGTITGEVSTDDILEEMFSKFCVGK